MSIFNWLRQPDKPAPPPPKPAPPLFDLGVSVDDFRDDPARVRALGTILNSPTFKMAASVVANCAPPHDISNEDDATHIAVRYGVGLGVRHAFTMLRILAQPEEKNEQIEVTWSVPEEEAETATEELNR